MQLTLLYSAVYAALQFTFHR